MSAVNANSFRQRSQKFFGIIAITVSVMYACIGVALWRLWPQLDFYREQITTRAAATCGCQSYLGVSQSPWLTTALVIVASVAAAAFIIGIVRLIISVIRTWRFEHILRSNIVRTTYWQNIPIHRVASNQCTAVCVGLLQPRVYITDGLLQQLNGWETLTVLQHEMSHARYTDPLYRWCFMILAALVPFGRNLAAHGLALIELAADEAVADEKRLRNVFIKLFSEPSVAPGLAATFFSVLNCRVDRLLGKPLPKPKLWPVLTVAVLISVSMVTGYRALAHSVQPLQLEQCLVEQPICQILMSPAPKQTVLPNMTVILYE